MENLLLIAHISAAHGIKGDVRLHYYGDTLKGLLAYKTYWTEKSDPIVFEYIKHIKENAYIARIKNITTRDQAENWQGQKLFIKTEQLPKIEEETYYHAHLIGCDLMLAHQEQPLGKVMAIENYGAGSFLECGHLRIPFTKEAVTHIDCDKKQIFVEKEYIIFDD